MDEIAKLLEQAETPRDRAMLLVLYKIANKLTDMDETLTTHRTEFVEHRDDTVRRREMFENKFDIHVVDEQRLLNRGMGAWMALTGVLVFLLGLGGWYVARHILDVAAMQQATIERNSNRLTAIEALIQVHLERNGVVVK